MKTAHYDPELPFLADLEQRVRAHAEQAFCAPTPGTQSVSLTERIWLRGSLLARVTRRTAILVGLLFLLAATTFGARSVFFTHIQSPLAVHQGAFALVASGHDNGDRWALRLYTRDGQLCRALVVVGQAEASRCAPSPGASNLAVTSLSSARNSYVFGVTGSRVRAVRVHSGSAILTVETHTPRGRLAHAAGLSGSARYFLGVLERPLGNDDPPALLTALDAADRPIGRARVVCLQEAGSPLCGP